MIKLVNLTKDDGDLNRLPQAAIECFGRYNFYFEPHYPTSSLLKMQNWDSTSYPENLCPEYYYNIDYRMLGLKDLSNEYRLYTDFLFFLVTSIDQKGILSPVNVYETRVFHPGGKRANIASYLGIETMPAIVQTIADLGNEGKISSLEHLLDLYGNNCSLIYRTEFDRIEVAWHGETGLRDSRGYDDWFAKADQITKKYFHGSVSEVVLEQGLEIVTEKPLSPVDEFYKLKFSRNPSSPIRIIILDPSWLECDLWELYFHIDPSIYRKIDETGTIIIENDYAKNDALELKNCKMNRTLMRKKFYTRDYIITK